MDDDQSLVEIIRVLARPEKVGREKVAFLSYFSLLLLLLKELIEWRADQLYK